MAEQIHVTVSVTKISRLVYEIRAVARGQFYKRQFVGYTEKKALKLFEQWLGEQL